MHVLSLIASSVVLVRGGSTFKKVLASINPCQTNQDCRSTHKTSQKQHCLISRLRALNTCNQKGNNGSEKNHEVVHTSIISLFCLSFLVFHVGFYQSHQDGVDKHEDAKDKDAIALLQVRSQANPERHTKDGGISKNRGQCCDALHAYNISSFCQ